jgi:hypothetical protein
MSGLLLLLLFLHLTQGGQLFSDTACSNLSIERYHALSDATMTTLLERLEDLLDTVGNDAYEVDYHVSMLEHTRMLTPQSCP